jgi:hypothetical protein
MIDQVEVLREDETQVQAQGMIAVAQSRAAQEVQAAMVVAKKFPRNEEAAFARVLRACKRKALAEGAIYAYPRGGQTVEGPSIRMAEVLAQNWGNIDFGIIELEQREGESVVMSYAWDLETNTRQTKVFNVPHERHTKHGITQLTDPRDIYEMVANQGARRLRACILGVIPGDVVESAVAECEKTLNGDNSEPLIDRVRKMVSMFAEIGVTPEMIEARLRHKLSATTATEVVNLGKVYKSIKDGMAKPADFFDEVAAPAGGSKAQQYADAAKKPQPPEQKSEAKTETPPASAPAKENGNTYAGWVDEQAKVEEQADKAAEKAKARKPLG